MERLYDWCAQHEQPEELVIKKLLKERAQNELHMHSVIGQNGPSELIKKVRELEKRATLQKKESTTQKNASNKSLCGSVTSSCIKCKKIGHRWYECPERAAKRNNSVNHITKPDDQLDRKTMEINNKFYSVLWDTGFSTNLIHLRYVKMIKDVSLVNLETPERFKLINGTTLEVNMEAKLRMTYDGEQREVKFKIYDGKKM